MKLTRHLLGALLLLGAAGAQLDFTRLNLFGRSVQSVTLYGQEYVRDDLLGRYWRIARAGEIVSVEGFGHLLLMPIDPDQQRATTSFNTVQVDTNRQPAATATLVHGHLYLPLSTLSAAIGAQYTPGQLTLPAPQLTGVSSRAGQRSDRVVLDLNRDVQVSSSLAAGTLKVVLEGARGRAQTYGTRGVYLPQLRLTSGAGGLILSVPLRAPSGYRVYKVAHPGGVRVVLDAGPGVSQDAPDLLTRQRRPRIVIDPQMVPSVNGGDAPLELARATGEILTKAGWQVQLTRTAAGDSSLASRLELARQSDLFLSLGLGRFPGASAGGVTLSGPAGSASAQIVNAVRSLDAPSRLLRAAVSGDGDNRRLADLITGELKALSLSPHVTSGRDLLLLREAPRAALNLEIGWPQNERDRARLSDAAQTQALATALARGVATYLAAQANKAGL